MRSIGFFLAVCLGLSLGAARIATVTAGEAAHDFTVVDSEAVYFGSGEHPTSPAVAVADEVWLAIPEYRKILDKNLTDDDPEYHLLMKRASERFQEALKSEAKRQGFDLIAEVDAVLANTGKTIPVVTRDLIDLVSRD